eukprot:GHVT01008603.1.p4 GENE.GHVT01008603.1~~GHVT01008603.1.p4  ORF type:complete len:100 (-),score=7.30 GHVT01008603.1:3003-3302(-)
MTVRLSNPLDHRTKTMYRHLLSREEFQSMARYIDPLGIRLGEATWKKPRDRFLFSRFRIVALDGVNIVEMEPTSVTKLLKTTTKIDLRAVAAVGEPHQQ